MVGVELVVGYVVGWAVRKARRVAGRADAEVDEALDAGMDRLHEVVAARLGGDPALERAEAEAGVDGPGLTDRTRLRLRLALEEAAEQDPAFQRELAEAVARIQAASQAAGPGARAVYGNTFNGPTALQIGDHTTQTNTFGA
ncbi:hypothetical protein SAMN05216267_10657 [Actinacidiphila rubida]|uniref:Chromosome partitioning protein n=1 Tax=Actinacidiphila rubida TaxID=310780 RepID=A0A1H8U7Q6_9ACTN|nr:chromosome partitioning protein [Actinacidiphila rubida]SEO98873.1 hypothetical protein SAMN05216267_10657 [Actinacidiphila rubida]